MGTVHRLDVGPAAPELEAAVRAFLTEVANLNTHRAYGLALHGLVTELGKTAPVAALDEESTLEQVARWFARRWGTAAAATVNARLDALRSAADWWRRQGWINGDPTRRIRRRPRTPDRTRSIDQTEIENLLTRPHLPLRERTLWRMLYGTAARAEEVLALDISELDLRDRRTKVR